MVDERKAVVEYGYEESMQKPVYVPIHPVKIGDSLKKAVDGMDVDAGELDALRKRWEIKKARIHAEDRKRVYGLIIQVVISVFASVLALLRSIDMVVFIVLVMVAMFISLGVNQWVHIRVQRIIWDALDDVSEQLP